MHQNSPLQLYILYNIMHLIFKMYLMQRWVISCAALFYQQWLSYCLSSRKASIALPINKSRLINRCWHSSCGSLQLLQSHHGSLCFFTVLFWLILNYVEVETNYHLGHIWRVMVAVDGILVYQSKGLIKTAINTLLLVVCLSLRIPVQSILSLEMLKGCDYCRSALYLYPLTVALLGFIEELVSGCG